ncbi:MAG TPA: hypothetical protein VKB09_00065 [Thermomicrobiales bacterium]|nr:hypothetical protein [Thermomicrobiales bacterium]
MNRRRFVVGGSASAVALTMAGLAAQRAVNAQDATPVPSTSTATPGTTQNEAQSGYQEFVAGLAANLGVADAATVNAAIRTTLKQLIDAEFAAGNISANDATALKAAIDAAESPLRIGGFGGRGGIGGRDGRGDRHGGPNDGRPNGSDKPGDTDQDETAPEATPTTA